MSEVTVVRDGEHWGGLNVKWGTSKEQKFTDTVTLPVYGVHKETRSPSVREETQQEDTCVYCGEPVTPAQYPCKGMPDGRKAHLTCYLDHEADEEPGRRTRGRTVH